MTILLLTLLGAAASVGFSCFQIQKQEEANDGTRAQIRQLQEMQRQSLEQQKTLLQNQSPRNKEVQVHLPPPPAKLQAGRPAAGKSGAPAAKASSATTAGRGYTELP